MTEIAIKDNRVQLLITANSILIFQSSHSSTNVRSNHILQCYTDAM